MKMAIVLGMAAFLVSSMAFAGDEPDWRPTSEGGTEPTVSAYLDKEPKPGTRNQFVVRGPAFRVVACPGRRVGNGVVYQYTRCPDGDKLKKYMRDVWCKENKGRQWFYRVGTNEMALPNTCPKR
jgi:hypothetical protein